MSNDKWGAGDKAKWKKPFREVKINNTLYPLITGENPHTRSDNSHYAIIKGEAIAFSGHHSCIGVEIKMKNYLKSSHLSGDEIRKGGSCIITSDNIEVYEFFARDIKWALLEAYRIISQLEEHSSDWLNTKERNNLAGRKIYYREIPAVITNLIVDQGCVMIEAANGKEFPKPIYNADDEDAIRVKTSVLDPNIYWHRE